jgi:hypothetical protein
MKKPPLNVLIGFIFATLATFQPIVIVDSDKVVLPQSPAWGLLVWSGIAVLLGLYGRKRREYIGPAILLGLNPIFTRFVLENQILNNLHISNVKVDYALGGWMAWAASMCIFSVVLSKDSDPSSDN